LQRSVELALKTGSIGASMEGLFYPQERTSSRRPSMSASCPTGDMYRNWGSSRQEFAAAVLTAICMTVSLLVSFWAARRFETFWQKFVFFLIASVISFFLFPFLAACGRALRLNRSI
jgi:hypothetical protein